VTSSGGRFSDAAAPRQGIPASVVVKNVRVILIDAGGLAGGAGGFVTDASSGVGVSHGVAARPRCINSTSTIPRLMLPSAGPCDPGTRPGVRKTGGAESQGRMDRGADWRAMVDALLTAPPWIAFGHDTGRAFRHRPDRERALGRRYGGERAFRRRPVRERAWGRKYGGERASRRGYGIQEALRRNRPARRRHRGWRPARCKRDGR